MVRSLAICFIYSSVGFAVIPAMWTVRVESFKDLLGGSRIGAIQR
jgi:hypothetical protein